MGNSTIIELNHDRWGEIYKDEESKQAFLNQIREQFQSFKHDKKDILGGEVILSCSRYDKRYDKFCKFVKEIH